MVLYKKNQEKNTMLKFELPSAPGSEVQMPRRLGYRTRMAVRSESYKVHIEQDGNGREKMFQTIDPGKMEYELVVRTLEDPRTFHNLTEEDQYGNEKRIAMDRLWVDESMDEEDALALGQYLMSVYNEQLGFEEDDTTPEGNAEEQSKNVSDLTEKRDSKRGPKVHQSQ